MARILVIDDEITLREFFKDYLEEAGYEVDVASDGDQGLQMFTAHPYDLVITDILMPNREGLETILELREHTPDVKIIAITGGGIGLGDDLLKLACEFGANRALFKPVPMKRLLAIVEEVLNEE